MASSYFVYKAPTEINWIIFSNLKTKNQLFFELNS